MLIDHIDGANRLIYLSIETVNATIHPIDIYKEMRTLRRTIEELRQYDVFLKAYGNVDKGGGKSTERYVQTIQNTKIIPWDATQEITINGTIITDDGQEGIAAFDRTSLSPGVEVDINYVPPQVEIITISTGGATPQSLWEYSDRTLTSGAASGDVNVVSIGGVAITSPADLGSQMAPGLLNTDITTFTTADTMGEAIWRSRFIPKAIYVDTEADTNGDGTQGLPFDNVNDAKDFVEESGINNIFVSGAIVVPRNLKNMNIYGIGLPTIDLNGQDIKNTRFNQVQLTGTYTSPIIAQECVLSDGFELDGYFQDCDLIGNYTAKPNTSISIITCTSGIPGLNRPTLSMNSGLPSSVSIRGFRGGLTIMDSDHVDDVITVGVAEGSLTFDSSCIAGVMVARGDCVFLDETAGAVVYDETSQNHVTNEATGVKNIVIATS